MKHCIGFDIGNHAVHIAVAKNGAVTRGLTLRLSEDLVKNGTVTSYEVMADFLKEARRSYDLKTANAALILSAAHCYCRRFFVAANTLDQLMFNLPYGFKDFITDDKSHYFFDCSVLSAVKYGDGKAPEFDVLAAATRKEVVEDYQVMFKRAGFKLKTIIPEEFSYINLLRRATSSHHHGILDIGHSAVKLFLFNGAVFESVRVIDYGLGALDDVIAEQLGVDKFMAATYRENDMNGANALEGCRSVYSAMALEVLKAINFYRFNGGGTLEHLHCCGGGAHNEVLMQTLARTLPLPLTDLSEFFGTDTSPSLDLPLIASAAGVALQ